MKKRMTSRQKYERFAKRMFWPIGRVQEVGPNGPHYAGYTGIWTQAGWLAWQEARLKRNR